MNIFENKVVWITGATSGIGEELAYRLSESNSKLVLSARRKEELLKVREKCANPPNVLILPLDLEKSENFEELAKTVVEHFGGIDYLFNNGGISQRSNVEDTSLTTDRRIMEINFFGNIALSKAVLPYMISAKKGHIIVTSSVAGKFGFFLRSSYSASKHALHGFYETMRLEQLENNIKITLLVPGSVRTNMSPNALTGEGAKHGKQDRMLEEGMTVDYCVRHILKAVRKNKEEAVFGNKEPLAVLIKRFLPGIFTGIMAKRKP